LVASLIPLTLSDKILQLLLLLILQYTASDYGNYLSLHEQKV